jgi:relaxase-like protein
MRIRRAGRWGMKRRLIDLRGGEEPILDIASYGRMAPPLNRHQLAQISLTVRRAPEVMVKVSGGARTVAGVEQHLAYIGREGALGLETDMGEMVSGKGIERSLVQDWNLDLDADRGPTERAIRRRSPPKLVHNVIFSMPSGTSPKALMGAVRKLALNEWQFKHRYVMALHTDSEHPHVHVVLMARDADGERLNIRKGGPSLLAGSICGEPSGARRHRQCNGTSSSRAEPYPKDGWDLPCCEAQGVNPYPQAVDGVGERGGRRGNQTRSRNRRC